MDNGPKTMTQRERATTLFRESQNQIHRRADRLFGNLMVAQWLAGIAAALWLSPKTWIGSSSQTHWHVWAAIFLGGGISALPVFLAWRRPGSTLTRHTIAVAQMLMSALLIHLSGGRIETHFHVFGSLAFFAFYRDWRVLLTATIVVAADHMVRGIFWPQSVFGILASSPWRWVEHAGWVVFEDIFLFISIRQSLQDMFEDAARRAKLESINTDIEQQVAKRTADLVDAHKEIEVSEQRFRTLCASAPIGIYLTDATGCCLYTNPQYQQITGLSLAESLGEGWKQAVHPDDAVRVFAARDISTNEGCEVDCEFRYCRANGEVRWVRARTTTMRSETGTVVSRVGTLEDITERKRAEEERRRMEIQLRHAQKMESIGQLAAGIAHEINTPTQFIGDNTRFLRDAFTDLQKLLEAQVRLMAAAQAGSVPHSLLAEVETATKTADMDYLSAEIPKALGQSLDGIARVTNIVRAMKDFSHPGSTEKTALDLNRAIESTLTVCCNEWKYVADVVSNFDTSLPPVPVLPGEFNQVILNIIINATHAIADVVGDGANGKGKITVSTRRDGEWVEVRIGDSGTGIPEHARQKVFDPFFTTKGVGKGTGQGLAIAHSVVVEKHGGTIHFETETGKGTTFIIRLPLISQAAGTERKAA